MLFDKMTAEVPQLRQYSVILKPLLLSVPDSGMRAGLTAVRDMIDGILDGCDDMTTEETTQLALSIGNEHAV